MKLAEVFRYELEYRLRSPSTWAYAALLFVFAWLNAADVGGPDGINANAPRQTAYDAALTGMLGLVVTAGLFGDAALRDIEAGMEPLLFTAPQRTIDHLGGRFLAALVVNAVLLFAVPLGFALPELIGYPDPTRFGPFRIAAVLEPWIILLLPNMALSGAVLFAVAVFSRRLTPVYITGFFLFFGALFWADVNVAFDPAGVGLLWTNRLNWTAAEQNSRLIGSITPLLWNRLLWLAVTGVVLALIHKNFRFTHPDVGGAPRERLDESNSVRAVRTPRVTPSFGFRTAARQTFAVARKSLVETAANPWFAGILLVSIVWTASLIEGVPGGPHDTTPWPVTLLVTTVLSRDLQVGFYVLVGLYAGEMLWKDRDVGVAEITDAIPMAEGSALVGRLLALVAMFGMLLAASMVGGILAQFAQDYYDVEPGLYLRVLFGMNLANGVLVIVLVMTVHVLVNHKYLGHVAMLMALVIPFAGPMVPHRLLVYGADPGWVYSDMNGFGPFLAPFVWFKLYAAGWALLLVVVACALWVRGRESGVRYRLRQARARLAGPLLRAVGVGFAVIITVGGFIFYNTNVLNAVRVDDDAGAVQAEYEKRYGRFANVPQPTIERARLRVEIYPDDPAVDLSGSFRLINRTAAPIDTIHVSTNPRLAARSISFDRESTPVVTDSVVKYRIYALARPLAPGDSMQLSFDVGFRQRGFRNSEPQTTVVANGTYFDRSWLPFVGYRRVRENKVHVETTIGTAADQIAITSGVLRREWMENGRRYFQYETEAPQPFEAPVVSGKYAVRAERWTDSSSASGNSVRVGVYHDPDHDRNLDTFVRAMKASLAYYSTHFGPYGASDLRIVEIPRYQRLARAHPNVLAFSEHNFFARVKAGEIDHLFFGTVHEIAHQWWGGRISGAVGARGGEPFLSEMLANYSAMMVTEKTYGVEAARRLYAAQMDEYFTGRASVANEVPLLEVRDQAYSRKGLLVMYLMRDYIGEAAVTTALRRFADKHRAGVPPYPTALDVVAELRAVTPDSLQYLLKDLFETVTLWDVRTERAIVDSTATGEYRVTLDVSAKKMRGTEVAMTDYIEVGAFAVGQGARLGKALYLQRHRIKSGKQTLAFTVREEPTGAGIDPYRMLIDRSGRDNVVNVERARR